MISACISFILIQAIAQVNCSGTGLLRHLEATYAFINLDESGILPGWTCIVSGCESDDSEIVYDAPFFYTPSKSCILQGEAE